MNDETPKRELSVPLPKAFPAPKRPTALIDALENLARKYWEDPEVQKYIAASTNKESITGTVAMDRWELSKVLRECATRDGLEDLFREILQVEFMKKMESALRRGNLGIEQRKAIAAGKESPPDEPEV